MNLDIFDDPVLANDPHLVALIWGAVHRTAQAALGVTAATITAEDLAHPIAPGTPGEMWVPDLYQGIATYGGPLLAALYTAPALTRTADGQIGISFHPLPPAPAAQSIINHGTHGSFTPLGDATGPTTRQDALAAITGDLTRVLGAMFQAAYGFTVAHRSPHHPPLPAFVNRPSCFANAMSIVIDMLDGDASQITGLAPMAQPSLGGPAPNDPATDYPPEDWG